MDDSSDRKAAEIARDEAILAAAGAIAKRGKTPTAKAVAKKTGLSWDIVQRRRTALRTLKRWPWPNGEFRCDRGDHKRFERLELAIIEAAGEIVDEGSYPSYARIAERSGKPLHRVRKRVQRMKRLGTWPFEVHSTPGAIAPDVRAMAIEMAGRPNTSKRGVCRAISRIAGRSIHRASLDHILANPEPQRPCVMGEAATVGVYARAEKVRAEPTRGEESRHTKDTQDARVHRITLANSTILRERRSLL